MRIQLETSSTSSILKRSSRTPIAAFLFFATFLPFAAFLLDPPAAVLLLLPAIALSVFVISDIKHASLMFACFMPHLGELESSPLLYQFWYIPWALFFLTWLIHIFVRPEQIFLDNWLTPLSILLGIVLVISLTSYVDLALCPQWMSELSSPWERTTEAFVTGSLGIMTISAVQTKQDLKRLFWVFVISGLVYVIPLFFFGLEAESTLLVGRRQGFFTDVHPAAMHMLFCSIISITLLHYEKRPKHRLFLMWCTGLFLFSQLFTLSRTVMLATLVCLMLVIGITKGWRWTFLGALLCLTGCIILWPFLPGSITSSIQTVSSALLGTYDANITQSSGANATFGARIESTSIGINLVPDAPWFGLGIGRHPWIANAFLHNYYVAMLVEIGIIGSSLYAIIISGALITLVRLRRRFLVINDLELSSMMLAMILIIIMILVIFTVSVGHTQGERHLWYLLGVIVACERIKQNPLATDLCNLSEKNVPKS